VIVEKHFLGFSPDAGRKCGRNCSRTHQCVTAVWYEAWFFTYEQHLIHVTFALEQEFYFNTGIVWNKGTACFDQLGCFLGIDHCNELGGVGYWGNTSNLFGATPPTADEWLAKARREAHADQYPEPGTISVCPQFHPYIGRRAD
jgi:hypothetical protein